MGSAVARRTTLVGLTAAALAGKAHAQGAAPGCGPPNPARATEITSISNSFPLLQFLTAELRACAAFPFESTMLTSIKRPVDAFALPTVWVLTPSFAHYGELWLERGFSSYFLNRAIVSAGTVVISISIGAVAGYALARYRGALGGGGDLDHAADRDRHPAVPGADRLRARPGRREGIAAMARIGLKRVRRRWGAMVGVNNVSIDIADRVFLVLLGPSGCGRTTTIRMVAGLKDASEGENWIGDRMVNALEPKDRDIAMVFQSFGLDAPLSVYEDIRFPLRVRGIPAAEHEARMRRAARMVDLVRLLGRRLRELSGRPARRARPRDRPRTERRPDGRAAVQPRRPAPRLHPRRDRAPARRRSR